MTWLRRQQDIASLFAVWALLFQVLLGPFAMAGHSFGATSLDGIICTTRGLASPAATLPKQTRHNDDCGVGCIHACRTACGMTPAGALASNAIGPGSSHTSCLPEGRGKPAISAQSQSEFCSRAPPPLG
jgi:hypothetical protein